MGDAGHRISVGDKDLLCKHLKSSFIPPYILDISLPASDQTNVISTAPIPATEMSSSDEFGTPGFNASAVDLTTADPKDVICALAASQNEYNGQLGARISALFVIMIVSSCATFFPIIAKRVPRLRIPLYVYLFARYFGAGVIVATAFVHLLDPAYSEIGPQTCVGMTGHWADYSWCPAIVLMSVMFIFLLDFGAERYGSFMAISLD